MLYPSLAELLHQVNSRYMLVNIIARRARELAVSYGDPSDERKPVSRAIEEIASRELRITHHEE